MTHIWEAVDHIVKKFDTGEDFLSFYHQMNENEPKFNIVDSLNALCGAYKTLGEIIDFNLETKTYDRENGTIEGIIALSIIDVEGDFNTDIFRWEAL